MPISGHNYNSSTMERFSNIFNFCIKIIAISLCSRDNNDSLLMTSLARTNKTVPGIFTMSSLQLISPIVDPSPIVYVVRERSLSVSGDQKMSLNRSVTSLETSVNRSLET